MKINRKCLTFCPAAAAPPKNLASRSACFRGSTLGPGEDWNESILEKAGPKSLGHVPRSLEAITVNH